MFQVLKWIGTGRLINKMPCLQSEQRKLTGKIKKLHEIDKPQVLKSEYTSSYAAWCTGREMCPQAILQPGGTAQWYSGPGFPAQHLPRKRPPKLRGDHFHLSD